MKSTFFFILIVVSFFAFEGCKSSSKISNNSSIQQTTKNNTTLSWTEQNPTRQYTLSSLDSAGRIKILATQTPTIGLVKNIDLDSTIKVNGKVDISYLLKMQSEIATLNNKSLSLLITKDALYRLSEAYFNGIIDSAKYHQLYLNVISQPVNLVNAEIELEEAKSETIFSETEKLKIELQKAQIELEKLKIEKGIYQPKEIKEERVEEKKTEEKKVEEKTSEEIEADKNKEK